MQISNSLATGSFVALAVLAPSAQADASIQPSIHLSQAAVVVVPSSPQQAGFMTGEWLGAPCQMIFQVDDGRSVVGDCATPAGPHHVFRGAYTAPDSITGTLTRIDPSGCQITVPASFHIDGENTADYSLPAWYGCGLNGVGAAFRAPIMRAQPLAAYVPGPFDMYLLGIAAADLEFTGGNTYIWTTDANGNRTQQLYAQGDHRQELIQRSDELGRVAAHNGGHLPSSGAKPGVAQQPSHSGAPNPPGRPGTITPPAGKVPPPPVNHLPSVPFKVPFKVPAKPAPTPPAKKVP